VGSQITLRIVAERKHGASISVHRIQKETCDEWMDSWWSRAACMFSPATSAPVAAHLLTGVELANGIAGETARA
jgi:hypothetical protein